MAPTEEEPDFEEAQVGVCMYVCVCVQSVCVGGGGREGRVEYCVCVQFVCVFNLYACVGGGRREALISVCMCPICVCSIFCACVWGEGGKR